MAIKLGERRARLAVEEGVIKDRTRSLDIVGVPFNSAGTTVGVARAPAALRRAGLVEALLDAGINVVDRGDVELAQLIPARDPISRLIAPSALVAMIRAVRTRVEASLRTVAFPLVIGGDCPIVLGCLGAGSGAPSSGLLFVDGHEDAWPPALSTTGEAADMELGFVLGLTVAGLPHDLLRELPTLIAADVAILGPRDERELAEAGVASIGDIVKVVRTEAIRAAPDRVAADAAADLGRRGDSWLHGLGWSSTEEGSASAIWIAERATLTGGADPMPTPSTASSGGCGEG